MRPLRLELVGFGPFAGAEVIDFAGLAGRDLFLIEGPTGAGKTSILDGVCFALYGAVPGPRRDAMAELRSTQADPAVLTQVTLDFELAGARYRVRRAPQQERPKKRGEGTTTHAAEAALFDLATGREVPLCKSNCIEVDAAVRALLGLSLEQFKQVLLLPQGEFRAFLLASSADKEKLLEQIFGTGLYKDVTEGLRRERLDLEKQVHDRRDRQGELLAQLGCATAVELGERVAALTDRISELDGAATAGHESVRIAGEALAALEKLSERFRRAESAARKLAEVSAESPRFEEARRALVQAEQAAPLAESFARRASAVREVARASAALATSNEARVLAERAATAAAARAGELPGLEAARELAARRVAEVELLETRHGGDLLALRELEAKLARATRELPTLRSALDMDRVRGERAAAELTELRRRREEGLAAELAAALVDGDPCPVCGACEHPAPARAHGRPVAAADLGKKEQALEQLRTRVESATGELAAAEAAAAEQGDAVARLRASLGELAGTGSLAEERARVTAQVTELARRIETLRREVDGSRTALQEATRREAERQEEARLRAEDADAATVELDRAARARRFADVAAAERALLPPDRTAALRESVRDHQERLAMATGRAQEASAEVDGLARPDLAVAQAELRAAQAALGATSAAAGAARNERENLVAARRRVGQLESELQAAEEQLRVTGRLAQVLAGENPRKLSLQRFVLASRMDEVALAASERLVRMSRGRYSLHRTDDVRHRGRGAGLELEVEDRQTGHRRSVHSLSGGEMFLASLALALGLADVVTRRSGGVRLDALFVDEGFGTLDDETLDEVVRTLEALRAGGRLVGLISHVAELKERISTRITVRPGPRGSHAELRL